MMRIHLAHNRLENGQPSGGLRAIEFGNHASFESVYIDAPICTCFVERDKVRLGRKTFPIISCAPWAGNWCWDTITVTSETANEILKHLRSLKYHGEPKMELTEASNEFWRLYHANRPISFRTKPVTPQPQPEPATTPRPPAQEADHA